MMTRLLTFRKLLSHRPSEIDSLLTWCITNPGYKNVYITKVQSHFIPLQIHLGVLTRFFRGHFLRFDLKRFISTLKKPEPENNFPILNHKYSEVESLISDTDTRFKYLEIVRNSSVLSQSDADLIYSNFIKTIDIVSGFSVPGSIDFLFDIWGSVFENKDSSRIIKELQYKLLDQKDVFIMVLINTKNFSIYEKLVKPLYNRQEFKDYTRSWTDKLAYTLQFDTDVHGNMTMNKGNIVQFLRNSENPIDTRRRLVSIFLRKGILYSQDSDQAYYIIKEFINLLHELGDQDILFIDHEHNIYTKAFRLIALPPKNIRFTDHLKNIKNIIDLSPHTTSRSYYNFMTTSMNAIIRFSPNNVLNFWQVKCNYVVDKGLDESEVFHHRDLRSAMSAFRLLNMHQSVLDLYQKHPDLHNEDQIEVLLKVSKESKDWKLMQKQFEDMYGKGQLPYVGHYSIVMNALAVIGAGAEVDQLYKQLLKRKLKPSSSVFAALINSKLFDNDIEGAKNWFAEYLKDNEKNKVDLDATTYLYSLIFKLYLKSSNIEAATTILKDAISQQKKLNTTLVNERSLSKFINFAGSTYGLKELELFRNLGTELDLSSEEYYENLIRSYTRLDQYERANDLVFEAHLECNVPFANPNIYKVQLRNYRFWYRNTSSHRTKRFISDRIDFILKHIESGKISVRNNHGLFTELIKLHLARNDLQNAEAVFKMAKSRDVLVENHFTPFLDYYTKQGTFSGYSQVLELYKEMAKEKLKISTRTYVYLIKALIHLDTLNHNGYLNSFKLLQSVLELNGLTVNASDPEPKVPSIDIFENSIDLCHIVTSYVMATVGYQNNVELLVHFLNQMKEKLDKKLTNEFKFSIFKEMGRLYLKQGNLLLASSLIDNGLKELEHISTKFITDFPYDEVPEYEIRIPKTLQYEYRTLLSLKLRCMKTYHEDPTKYLELLKSSNKCKVHLSGDQYNLLIGQIIQISDPNVLRSVLLVCEDHLVAGNWSEAKLFRKLQFMYKLTVLHFSKSIGIEVARNNYAILNRFYNVRDIPKLQAALSHIQDPLSLLKQELLEFNETHSNAHYKGSYWTLDKVLLDIPGFFSPEIRIPTQNKIPPYNVSKIWHAVTKYCDGNINQAFELMDEFPETIEFLIYNGPARLRAHIFRKEIDTIQLRPASDQTEDFESRRLRTLEALNHLKTSQSSY